MAEEIVASTVNAGFQMIIILFYFKPYDGVVPYDTVNRKWIFKVLLEKDMFHISRNKIKYLMFITNMNFFFLIH